MRHDFARTFERRHRHIEHPGAEVCGGKLPVPIFEISADRYAVGLEPGLVDFSRHPRRSVRRHRHRQSQCRKEPPNPDASFVRLHVYLTELGKSGTITRKISEPRMPKMEPADDDVKAALAEVADHPEIALSRREILRFILVEPTKRPAAC